MNITIREATMDDARYIAKHLRKEDRDEILALGQMTPGAMVTTSFVGSDVSFVGVIDGVPALIFGTGQKLRSDTAEIWALGTDECFKAPLAMVKYGRRVVKELLEYYPALENYCDARYTRSLRWLRQIGFTIGEPEPYGDAGALFCKLSIKRED